MRRLSDFDRLIRLTHAFVFDSASDCLQFKRVCNISHRINFGIQIKYSYSDTNGTEQDVYV